MSRPNPLAELIERVEHYLECWKQYSHYLGLARSKQFESDDEAQFLELQSVIAQELEMIYAAVESGLPSREEVHALVAATPSIRYVSELNEGALKALESQWHRLFIAWQSLLGQLKVQQRQTETPGRWSLFGRK